MNQGQCEAAATLAFSSLLSIESRYPSNLLPLRRPVVAPSAFTLSLSFRSASPSPVPHLMVLWIDVDSSLRPGRAGHGRKAHIESAMELPFYVRAPGLER